MVKTEARPIGGWVEFGSPSCLIGWSSRTEYFLRLEIIIHRELPPDWYADCRRESQYNKERACRMVLRANWYAVAPRVKKHLSVPGGMGVSDRILIYSSLFYDQIFSNLAMAMLIPLILQDSRPRLSQLCKSAKLFAVHRYPYVCKSVKLLAGKYG